MIPLWIPPLNSIVERNCRVRWAERRLASPSIRTRKGIIPSIHMRLTFCSSEHITIFWPNPLSLTLSRIVFYTNHPFQNCTPQTRFAPHFFHTDSILPHTKNHLNSSRIKGIPEPASQNTPDFAHSHSPEKRNCQRTMTLPMVAETVPLGGASIPFSA